MLEILSLPETPLSCQTLRSARASPELRSAEDAGVNTRPYRYNYLTIGCGLGYSPHHQSPNQPGGAPPSQEVCQAFLLPRKRGRPPVGPKRRATASPAQMRARVGVPATGPPKTNPLPSAYLVPTTNLIRSLRY